jgi:CBS domain-containing protein
VCGEGWLASSGPRGDAGALESRKDESMKVEELMTQDVKACAPQDSLSRVAELLWEIDIGVLPVIDAEERVVGMVTDRDVCMAAYFKGRPLAEIGVDETMSHKVYSCLGTDSVEDAERMMLSYQIRRLPVVSSGQRLVGIISLNDIALQCERELGKREPEVAPDEVARTLAGICRPHIVKPEREIEFQPVGRRAPEHSAAESRPARARKAR